MTEEKEALTGITAAIIHDGKVLLLRRRKMPFISNPGIWSLVMGGRKKRETFLQTAYREIEEETKIKKGELKLVSRPIKIHLFDLKKEEPWTNYFYVFASRRKQIKLSIENSAWRWATMKDIIERKDYTNVFLEFSKIERILEVEVLGKKQKHLE